MNRVTLRCNNRADWLEYRKPDITSTDTAALFGLSPYKTKFELYHKHASGIVLDFKENDRMRKGNALEAGIAELAAEQEGWTDLAPFKDYMRLPDLRIGSSFDFIANRDGKRLLVEIKLVDPFRYRDMWVDGQAPDHIEIQAAHEMMVADVDQIAIVAWTGGYDCNVIYRDRDPEMEAAMFATIAQFWADVDAKNEPAPDFANDEATIAALFRSLRAQPEDMSDAGIDDLVTQFELANMQKLEFEKQAKELKAQLHFRLGDIAEAFTNRYKIKAGWTKDTEGTEVTADMIGTRIGARKGYRRLDIKRLAVEG